MSVRELSRRLDTLGVTMSPSAITKIETGARGVDIDELVALAVALGVSPLRLLLPDRGDVDDSEGDVYLTPNRKVIWRHAWEWARGESPLDDADRTGVAARDAAFRWSAENQPDREGRRRPFLEMDPLALTIDPYNPGEVFSPEGLKQFDEAAGFIRATITSILERPLSGEH